MPHGDKRIICAWLQLLPWMLFGCVCSCSWEPTPLAPIVDDGVAHQGGGVAEADLFTSEPGKNVDYPAGPYGITVGSVVRNYRFVGFVNPKESNYKATADSIKVIEFADFYNPTADRSKPLGLLVNASARWCPACKAEATTSNSAYNHWKPKGIEFLTAIFENDKREPSEFKDIELWSKLYRLEYPVVMDPNLSLGAFFNVSAAPFNMVIDTRTMTIISTQEGAIDLGPSNEDFAKLMAN